MFTHRRTLEPRGSPHCPTVVPRYGNAAPDIFARRPAGPPGRDRRRGDRLGEDHPAAEDLPGPGTRRAGDDRAHPAAPAGGPHGGRTHRTGAGDPARRPRRLQGPVHRPGRRRHAGQADDRRHPAGGDPAGPPAAPVRHAHHRRGARAQPQHRLHPRLPQTAAAAPTRPEGDHHFGDHRPGAVLPPLRRRAGDRGLRPHLSGGGPLPADRRGGRRRPRPDPGDLRRGGGAVRRGAGGHPRLPQRRAGDPRHRRRAEKAPPARHRDPAAVRAPVGGRPTPGVPAPHRAPHRAGNQRRGDLAHGAGHQVRDRPGDRAHLPLQPPDQGAAPTHRAHLPGLRQPAQGTLRPGLGGDLHPAVLRAGLPVAP